MRTALSILALILSFSLFAQDEELAAQYYSQGEYDKAAALYKKLHRGKPESVYIYENYLECILALEDQKTAESVVEKMIKRNPGQMNYAVDLGYVYYFFKEDERAEDYFNKLIRDNTRSKGKTYALATAFQKRQYIEWAILCYEEASRNQGDLNFWQQLMSLYRITGDYESMSKMGLEVLHAYPNYLGYVYQLFGNTLEDEKAANYIQKSTLQYVQKYPNEPVFDELLMRIYIQRKKFNAAYNQAFAMDKRNNEEGKRFLDLAEHCLASKEYDVAIKCFQALINKGSSSLFYMDGESGILNTLYLKITTSFDPDSAEVRSLVNGYEDFISEYGYNGATSESARRLAELHLFYTRDIIRSITVLNKILEVRVLHPNLKGEVKLLLGDAYLIRNEVWEARLLYGQVDKEFKEDPLGQEAKFRNAKLAYYLGDFEWARGQLDILKIATSQLISNNAIELSLLIQDNTGLDSTEDAMKEYAHAEFLLYQNKIEECLQVLNMLPFKYPNHSLQDEIYYLKAQVMAKTGRFDKALEYYQKVYTAYGSDILADNALFNAAEIYQFVKMDAEKALSLYETIILDYNSSLYVIEARKRYEDLKRDPS